MGIGKSEHTGKKIAATLARTGTLASYAYPPEAGHGDQGMITSHEVVIANSHSDKNDELLRVVPNVKRNRIKLIVPSGNPRSPLANLADLLIDTSVPKEACHLGLAPTNRTTLTSALGDAVAICLLNAAKFNKKDKAATHHNGSLRRKLHDAVRDVMIDREVPLFWKAISR